MVKQNRNTIDGLDKTELNNKSPDDLCFDPSDASITPSPDKSIPNNVLDVLVKLGDKKVNNDPKSTADTNNADQSEAVLLEDTVSKLLDKIIEKRVNQRLSELGITDSNGSLNKSSIEEIEEKKSKQSLKAPNIPASKEIVKRKFMKALESAIEDAFHWGDAKHAIEEKVKERTREIEIQKSFFMQLFTLQLLADLKCHTPKKFGFLFCFYNVLLY